MCSRVLILMLFPLASLAQSVFPVKDYKQYAYSSPVRIPLLLAGNYGECRPNHFHAGIDIRTNSKENLQVFSVSRGYVSRVKISAGGYGNAIYITHPDGFTALYAHMNNFFPELEQYVRAQQYRSESWEQDMVLMPYQFPLKQGSFIGWSGNTGSSQGPHIHFEIRETKTEVPLDPIPFLPGISDHKAPVLKYLAIYDAEKSIYEQNPEMIAASAKSAVIKIPARKVFLGIQGDDFMDQNAATLGIKEMQLYVNDVAVIAWQMQGIAFDKSLYVNAHADYKTKKSKGNWIQLCAKLPNDQLNIYKWLGNGDGVFELSTDRASDIRIVLLDARMNKSVYRFKLVSESDAGTVRGCAERFEAGQPARFDDDWIRFELDKDALYSDICFSASAEASALPYSMRYRLHSSLVPLHRGFELSLKPKQEIPPALHSKLYVRYRASAASQADYGKAARWQQGRVVAEVKHFGYYEIVTDTQPPVIQTKLKNGDDISGRSKLYFSASEESTTITSFSAHVEGQWLRLSRKGNVYCYETDDHFPAGTHTLTLEARDENNNHARLSIELTRNIKTP